MEELYLTEQLKSYYMNDFNELSKLDAEFWSINNELKNILININHNESIQTLYSKIPDFSKPSLCSESYLEIAYVKEIELQLFRTIIPQFLILFNTDEYQKFSYSFFFPRSNANHTGNNRFNIGCITNKNYFNINTIKFELVADENSIHNNFWKKLEMNLSVLNNK
jgi:hypothetical protein